MAINWFIKYGYVGFLFMAFKNDSASNGAQSIGTFSSITTNDNNVQLMDCSPFYEVRLLCNNYFKIFCNTQLCCYILNNRML